ncbi:MAG: hypothetical protein HOF49_04595 [Nitrosomonadales bacterium]|jgi:hypothetical protein|nr:hypothetical protein [Nitrosomonadales bacterium]MBT3918706.1 hypothetical protein [Nitrosomonadales bacterium]MBT5149961.1 hypothetical protein [Nitrosomonadales bacterium]MBT5573013.1 hypothetical protein [Nitrosomonadales bacterium]MBT6817943.1 hypothetical protein [Nitrosomonadales bacterium]
MRKILFALFLLGLISSASADKDFEDDEFYGKIESMPENSFEGDWVIDGKTYQVTSETDIDEDDGNAKIGACVEVEIDAGDNDAGRVEQIEVKKYSFLCGFYDLID